MSKPIFQPGIQLPYPSRAQRMRRTGVASAMLIVNKDGSWKLDGPVTEAPPGIGFKEAFLKYLENGKFTPSYRNGRPVTVKYKYTIQFKL